ncbi:24423_t:CDS:1, partial [Racocetra persica]
SYLLKTLNKQIKEANRLYLQISELLSELCYKNNTIHPAEPPSGKTEKKDDLLLS